MKGRVLVLVLLLVLLSLPSPGGAQPEPEVCMACFYDAGSHAAMGSLVASLAAQYSFLEVELYNASERNSQAYNLLYELSTSYNVTAGLPAVFMGNSHYHLNASLAGYNATVERLAADIQTYASLGGVECPIAMDGRARFPRPVCVLGFYNQSDSGLDPVEQALRGNVSYVHLTRLNVSSQRMRFTEICRQLNVTLSMPAVVIGSQGFSLDDTSLETVISAAERYEKTGVACPSSGNESICIVFFYSPTCKHCREAEYRLDDLESRYPLNVTSYIDIINPDLLSRYYASANVSDKGSFAVFVGDRHYGYLDDFDELDAYIQAHVDTGLPCPEPAEESTAEADVRELTVLTVIAGGLVDGINPCAFATLVFFIAYLERARQKRRALLFIGVAFSAAVFVGYLLIGVGLLEFYYGIEHLGEISRYVYLFAGFFALAIAAFNVADYVRIGRDEQVVLQLPRFLKRRRGRLIRVLTGRHGIAMLAALAFATGLGISLLEFVCTGQVLFPVMAVIKQASPLWLTAFSYLLLYTAMFIVPLLVILALFYTGYTSDRLGEWQRRHQGAVKLLTAAVLGVVGVMMLWVTLG
ncbi:MAG: hypothetical protein R6U10_04025 [Thermoplasmatota archaeon]